MLSGHRVDVTDSRHSGGWVAVMTIIAVCLLIFVDVELPLVGNSNPLLGVLLLFFLVVEGRVPRAPFCCAMVVLLPLYFLFPMLFRYGVDVGAAVKVLIYQLLALVGILFVVRAVASSYQRQIFMDVYILCGVISGVVAGLQRFGVLGPLGRDRWGHSTTGLGDLRGAAFLSDPNFLAVLLASCVPLIVNWRYMWLRPPALVIVAFGLYSTNSRLGMFLAVAALAVSIVGRKATTRVNVAAGEQRLVTIVGACLICLFIFNVGGQRNRAINAIFVQLGLQDRIGAADVTDAFVALERRNLFEAWVNLGINNFPFGAGSGAQTQLGKAAHNTFATLFGEGGVVGLAIALLFVLSLILFVRFRKEPFAIMGAVIVLGSLFLSYPGSVFLLLPMGLADGILAARLGKHASPALVPQSRAEAEQTGAVEKSLWTRT